MHTPLTLDALRVLDAIERKKSFAAAAEELFRVPSALSYTVSRLEQALGTPLFDRSRQRATLTPVGRLLLEQGRPILRAADALTRMAQAAADGWERDLVIAVDSLLDVGVLYPLLQDFLAQAAPTAIRLTEEVLGGSWDALASGRCDLVIGAAGEPSGGGLASLALGTVEFVFAAAPAHPLCARPAPLKTEDLDGVTQIVVADSSRQTPARSAGLIDSPHPLVVPGIAQKIAAQCAGLGVGYLPRHRILDALETGQLVALEIDAPRPSQTLFAAWRSGGRGRALDWFISRLHGLRLDAHGALVPADGDTEGDLPARTRASIAKVHPDDVGDRSSRTHAGENPVGYTP